RPTEGDLREHRRLRDRAPGPAAARARRISRRTPERSAAAALRRPRTRYRPDRAGAHRRRRAARGQTARGDEAPRPLARQPPVLPQGMNAIVARIDAYERLLRLDKPVGALLLLWPTLWGVWIASSGRPSWQVAWIFVLGTFVMRSAGCA